MNSEVHSREGILSDRTPGMRGRFATPLVTHETLESQKTYIKYTHESACNSIQCLMSLTFNLSRLLRNVFDRTKSRGFKNGESN